MTLDELSQLALPVLRHRILVNFKGQAEGISADDVTRRLLAEVSPPESPLT